jgi:hypothetical protein
MLSKMDLLKLQDMLIEDQNNDPDRLNPARDELRQILWGKVKAYPFRAVQPRCIAVLEKALRANDLPPLQWLAQTAFPF